MSRLAKGVNRLELTILVDVAGESSQDVAMVKKNFNKLE